MRKASHLFHQSAGPVHIELEIHTMDAVEAIDVYHQDRRFESGGYRVEALCNGYPCGVEFFPKGIMRTGYDGGDDTENIASKFYYAEIKASRDPHYPDDVQVVDQSEATIEKINETLAKLGAQERLEEVDGYLRFVGGNASYWPNNRIDTKLGEQSVQQWIEAWHKRYAGFLIDQNESSIMIAHIKDSGVDSYEETRGDYTLRVEPGPDPYREDEYEITISWREDGVDEIVYTDNEYSFSAALQNGINEIRRYVPDNQVLMKVESSTSTDELVP